MPIAISVTHAIPFNDASAGNLQQLRKMLGELNIACV